MWPWDWVTALGSGISGISQKIYDWVSQQIASVMSWVTSAISDIWNAISAIYRDISNLWNQIVGFVVNLIGTITLWVENIVQGITRWVEQLVGSLWQRVTDVINWILGEIGRISAYVSSAVQNIIRWVYNDVWLPIVRAVNDVRNFAVQWIGRIWQYFEHPELLVALIAGNLLRLWQQYILRFGTAIAKWLLRKMMGLAGEVFDLLEMILSAII